MTWYYRLCLRHLKHLDTCTTRSAWEHRPHWGRWFCLRENMFGAGASWEKWSALCLLFHTYNLEFWPRMKWYDRDWLKSLGTEIPHAWFILGGLLKWRISSRHHGFQYVSILKWSSMTWMIWGYPHRIFSTGHGISTTSSISMGWQRTGPVAIDVSWNTWLLQLEIRDIS